MSGTILLADDSLTIQKVVELTFADTDYRVVAVSSGDDLLERLPGLSPDLIICDVIMPGKDGYDVCQEIKSSSDWLHLPVILLTGTFEPFDRDRAIAAGCSEIITKPFEAQKLVDTVERLIGGAQPAAAPSGLAGSFMDEVDEWPDEATPVEVPPDPTPDTDTDSFGTQLSQAGGGQDDDGIEFTTSGFAEMEAAGQASATPPPETDDGLDFDSDTGFGGSSDEVTAEVPPPVSSPAELDDGAAQTVRIDVSEYAVDDTSDDEPDDAASAADVPEAAVEPVTEPFAGTDEEPFGTTSETITGAVEEPGAADESESGTADTPEFKDEPSMADTSPVEPPVEADQPASQPIAVGDVELSEEDVDRIARRVVELASDRLDQIAWEILPDMAEIVVRQRIRELEAEADAAAPDTVQ